MKASVYEKDKRYSLTTKNITEICNIDYVCVDDDLPSIHLRLPLESRTKLESNPKLMHTSASYIKVKIQSDEIDENPLRLKEKHFFKNTVFLPEERLFHGVIDRSDNPTDESIHYIHYTFQLSADYQYIMGGAIEYYGPLHRHFEILPNRATNFTHNTMKLNEEFWKKVSELKHLKIVNYPYLIKDKSLGRP